MTRKAYFASSAIGALAILAAFPAHAQSEAAAAASDAADGSDGGALGEIIVTAQRRAENLQRVPITITVASAERLENANIASAMDIGKISPTVQLQANNGSVQAFMRGVGTNIAPVGNEQSNALYIDGVYLARTAPVLFRLNNVERVEVLKGPQGTLFGRNATAGLVQVITREPKPGEGPEANFSVGYANYRTVEASAYVATGLGEKVATDLALYYRDQHDGWGKNIFLGTDILKGRSWAVRNKWVFTPSDRTKIVAAADYGYDNSDQGTTGEFASSNSAPRYYPSPILDATGAVDPNPPFQGARPRLSAYDTDYTYDTKASARAYGGYVRVEQDIDFAKIVNITAYRETKQKFFQDSDFGPTDYFNPSLPSFAKQFSNEFQLQSNDESRIKWIGGLFYMWQNQGYSPAVITGSENPGFGPGGALIAPANQKVNSLAAFAQATVPLTDTISFTGGLRYLRDKVAAKGRLAFALNGTEVLTLLPPTSADATFKKVTWNAVLNYQPTSDLMLYASARRGFKSGLFNLLTFDPTPIDGETLDAYEVGFKSELLDRHLRVNGAMFYYDWKKPQSEIVLPGGAAGIRNAGAARVKGAELELTAAITSELSIILAGTYVDGKYTDYANAPGYIPNPANSFPSLISVVIPNGDGQRLPYAPKFSGSASVQYSKDVGAGQRIGMSANLSYTGKQYWHVDNRNFQKGYGVLDASIWYGFADDSIRVRIWGSNLTNKTYYLHQYEVAYGDNAAVAAPRTYGMTLSYKYR